jgi:hypothetical protein
VEAADSGGLSYPHVTAIHAVEDADGGALIVMEI